MHARSKRSKGVTDSKREAAMDLGRETRFRVAGFDFLTAAGSSALGTH